MNRVDVLNQAEQLINGPRAKDYGDARENFGRVAQVWSALLDQHIEPEQVALCMTALKMCRLAKTLDHTDSWIDAAGYIALGAEIATKDKTE
mgnify:FL=1